MGRQLAMAADGPEIPTVLFAGMGAAISAALGAIGLWLANRLIGKAAVQSAMTSGFKVLMDESRADRAELRKEFDDLKVEAAATEAQLRGEIVNLRQTIESLKRILRDNDIPVPDYHKSIADFILLGDHKK